MKKFWAKFQGDLRRTKREHNCGDSLIFGTSYQLWFLKSSFIFSAFLKRASFIPGSVPVACGLGRIYWSDGLAALFFFLMDTLLLAAVSSIDGGYFSH